MAVRARCAPERRLGLTFTCLLTLQALGGVLTPGQVWAQGYGIALIGASLAAAAEGPREAPAPAPAAQHVSFNAQIIEASNPPKPAPADPRLAALVAELKRLFQFTQYRLVGTPAGSAPVGQMWQAPLPGGVTLQATPTAVEPAGIQVQVRLLRGGALVVNSQVRVTSGGQVLVGGTPSPQGTLIVALQARLQ